MGKDSHNHSLAGDYIDVEATTNDAVAGLWRGTFVPPWEWLAEIGGKPHP